MRTDFKADESRADGLGCESLFLTPFLADGCNFLCSLERYGERGWPQYKNGPISLYHTSVAVSALAGADFRKFRSEIARAALEVTDTFADNLQALNIEDLTHFASILIDERDCDISILDCLGEELEKRLQRFVDRPEGLPVRKFADALRIVSFTNSASNRLLKDCTQQLLRLELAGDGGWPGAPNGGPSPIATAVTVEALLAADPNNTTDSIQRALVFLEKSVMDSSRIGKTLEPDLFMYATTLRIFAKCHMYSLIDSGVTKVREFQNVDGGWGNAPQQPSSVEATSVALRALVACGENRFVLYRNAAARVAVTERRIAVLENQVSKNQQELDEKVSRQSNKILEDRNALRRENGELLRQMEELRIENQEVQRVALMEARQSSSLQNLLLHEGSLSAGPRDRFFRWAEQIIPGITLGICTSFYFVNKAAKESSHLSLWLLLSIVGVSASGWLLTMYRSVVRSRDFYAKLKTISVKPESTSSISSAVMHFAEVAIELPTELREELIYIIVSRVIEMPPEIGVGYVQDFLSHMKVPNHVNRRTNTWVVEFLSLDPYSRRIVVDQIRRQALI